MYDTIEEIKQAYKDGKLATWEYEVMIKLRKERENWSEIAKIVNEYAQAKKETDRS